MIIDHGLLVYNDLIHREMLKRFLHDKTQNANACFNGMICERIPQIPCVGQDNLELGFYDATMESRLVWTFLKKWTLILEYI